MDAYKQTVGEGLELHVFDPRSEVLKIDRTLPHWSQAGALCFITFRTDDSIPQPLLNRWLKDRWTWLNKHGIDPGGRNWRTEFSNLDRVLQSEFQETFSSRWHNLIDQGYGACVLRQPEFSTIVSDALQYFDNDRYVLTDYVIMPNHVHVLCAFAHDDAMLKQCESWKHYTARRINQRLGVAGRFWQQDGFDHLIRSVEEFEAKRRYIGDNPRKANLGPTEFVHFAKAL